MEISHTHQSRSLENIFLVVHLHFGLVTSIHYSSGNILGVFQLHASKEEVIIIQRNSLIVKVDIPVEIIDGVVWSGALNLPIHVGKVLISCL